MVETLKSLLEKSDEELTALCAFDPARKADRGLQIKVRDGLTRLFDQKYNEVPVVINFRKFIIDRANRRFAAQGVR